ncbi:unnamed protein product [Microthlaspi erraticum]|uniref:Uncharacterized protein n=1 Tax=Microthlaspi erraticum TaxID=1685480 RepID=A0A6D2L8W8_9BRAS|nr:unnamed protein product [Microthlaspi erraticum]
MAELTYRPGKHRPVVEPFQPRHHKPRTTAQCEPGSIVSRPRGIHHVPQPIQPSTRKGSSHNRSRTFGQIIHPSDPDGRTRKLSATIVPTVPIADHDPIAGRSSRPTSEQSGRPEARFDTFSRPDLT